MRKLDKAPQIIEMANALGLSGPSPAKAIVNYCIEKVSSWCKEAEGIKTIGDVEKLVCKRLNLVFEEFRDLEGLKTIIRKYVAKGETVFATLINEFDAQTFATLLERRKITGRSHDRYVAVIDCRGSKGHRRFFTRWHEIAHLLTLYNQLQLPLHRSTIKQDPLEQMMDLIAGSVGFFDELMQPIIEREVELNGYLSLAAVDRIRQAYCPEASFASTLKACASRVSKPILYIEAGLGLKKKEEEFADSGLIDLLDLPKPILKVRALVVVPNEAARGRIEIHRNMEIPESCVLAKIQKQEGEFTFLQSGSANEDLSAWRHSDGSCLPACAVRIEGRRSGDRVIALVQLRH